MHIPLRMCISCRAHRPVDEMIRLAADKERQRIVADGVKKLDGRGVYVCRSADCIRKAEKKRIAEHKLNCEAEEGLYDKLEEML